MSAKGHCNCGAVRFEVTAPFVGATYCHCTRCQRRTGTAASVQAQVEPGSVNIISGADRLRGWTPVDGMEKLFCGDCGSAMFSRNPATQQMLSVRFGVLDEDPGIRPQLRQYVDTAATWEPIPDDGLPRYAGPPE
ncbi:MAG TPA: GFA family protein [Baekduia sp.]|nr:GFA family protein [Baekduia sp.]